MAASLGTVASDVFYVGDEDGWVGRPAESYDHWAGRRHFHINDTLVFMYKDADSMLVVDMRHYEACDRSDRIEKMSHGDSAYVLGKAGPFYFIGGDLGRCKNGQKLIVVVITDPPLSL
ncbi:hypothetical protein E2562_034041 [Oryza meyeriana var. granulata]|uniref:Phytocyanin domain-containing protein n=1 Tax=Oryza meyeriana var. granulata TaxID=110450 RepID=A0A6G1E8F2_9ORYZ|nr:hypothetical protein E2562_034041 [Oryza meyeriana var. granulata]